ncbi:hypothetical protein [Comamonas testosteroni]|uniref:hypothetical protein n=1 Tax=Comamonas testosteroni TaxID=285 RepID=UPI003D0D4325
MRQNEQLQRRAVFSPSLSSTEKRTAPQWQLACSGWDRSRLGMSMTVSIKGGYVASVEINAIQYRSNQTQTLMQQALEAMKLGISRSGNF